MIHTCFFLHDGNGTYTKYLGVAIHSLLKNTSHRITVHLFHDKTLSAVKAEKLKATVSKFNQKLILYEISEDEFRDLSTMVKHAALSTLFRLKVPDLLPKDIDRVIWLDADLIVHLDIYQLWQTDLGDYFVAACKDAKGKRFPCVQGLIAEHEYFNSGVMMLDLCKIRKNIDLLKEGVSFLKKYPMCTLAEQDALNVILAGKVYYWPSHFNFLTRPARHNRIEIMEAIYHFAGDYVDLVEPETVDILFVEYWMESLWGDRKSVYQFFSGLLEKIQKNDEVTKLFVKKTTQKNFKKIVFGATSQLCAGFLSVVSLNENDYYVDNNKEIQGRSVDGVNVFSPQQILSEVKGTFIVIVLSIKYYFEISEQLLSYGLKENEDFIDGRRLLTQRQGGYGGYY